MGNGRIWNNFKFALFAFCTVFDHQRDGNYFSSSCLLAAQCTYLYAKEGCEDNIGDDDQVHLMTVIVTIVMSITMTVTMTIVTTVTITIVMTVTMIIVLTVTMIIRMMVMMMMMTIMMTEIMLMTIRARPTSLRKLRVIRITRIRYMMENTPSVTPCKHRCQSQLSIK